MAKAKGNISKDELLEQISRLNAEIEQLKSELGNASTTVTGMPFHTVSANISDFICVFNMDGIIEYINPAGVKKLGYTLSKELTGQNISLLNPSQNKEDYTGLNLSSGRYRTKIEDKKSHVFPVEVHANTLRDKDGIKIIAIINDIPATPEKQGNIFESSPLAVFQYNMQGEIIECNDEFLSKNGLSREKILGVKLYDLISDPKLIKVLQEAFITGEAEFEGKLRIEKKREDTDVWIKIHLKGVKKKNGKISSVIGLVENITNRVSTQKEIARTKRNLERAERIANVGNWEFNLNTNKVYSSAGARAIYGIEKREYSISEIQQIPLIQYRKKLDKALKELIENGKPYDMVFKIRRVSDNMLRDIHSIAEYDSKNNIIFGVIRDISVTCQQQEALKESEERFRTLFFENNSAMLLIDPTTGQIADANNAAEKFYQLNQKDLKQKRIQEINTLNNDEIEEEIRKVRNGRHTVFHFKHKIANGEIKDVEVYSGLIKLNNRPLLYSTVHDITQRTKALQELKDNEERLRLALHASQQGLWDVNLIDFSVETSPEYATMLGYNPGTFSMTLTKWENNLHPDDLESTKDRFYGYMHEVYKDYQVEFRLKTKSGNYKWIMSTGKIISWDKNGKPSRMIGIHTDISHIKAVEFELLEAKEKAEENNRLKTAFLQNMSHEIRTPMNGIMGFSELLTEEGLDEPDRLEYADIIYRNSKQLLRIVNDILDISRLDSGQLQINKDTFNLIELLNSQAKFYTPQINLMQLEFQFVNDTGSEVCIVNSDSSRIKQILDNLLNNALKFTEKGYIRLGLYEDHKFYTIYVEDTGYGIPESKLKDIFNRFEQSHSHMVPGGAGLGLSISRELARLLGGKLWVQSEEMKGSLFSFSIPK